jgi:hypothetical protein
MGNVGVVPFVLAMPTLVLTMMPTFFRAISPTALVHVHTGFLAQHSSRLVAESGKGG